MKTCVKCLETKDLSQFYKQSDRVSGTSYCKSCKNSYDMARWTQRKVDAVEYKGGKCQLCGYNKYYGALEFHHNNPLEKDHEWTKLRLQSWDKIVAELDKCTLLCANCHRETHYALSN